jgi:acyl carrier protein
MYVFRLGHRRLVPYLGSHMEYDKATDLATIGGLLDRIKVDSSRELTLETLLLEDLGLDSLSLIYLVEEIQRVLDVEFLPEDYSYENLHSVATLLELVSRIRDRTNSRE